ncbi:RecX family transcriptional regulator [Selenomonas sp. TAMA-11512]|uniref:regulatory protein RecX n=1 Tax=Selenomonas sp. TAMA-11512 TaxID=3095337 RepID=UPI0030D3758E
MRRQKKSEKTALMTATDLLARAEQSSGRLKDKLRLRGYDEAEAAEAVEKLTERGYIDDADACRRQFDFLYEESRQSVRQIMAKLLQRGFSQELIRSCVPDDICERERAAAIRALELKYKPDADRKKMMEHLYRKGYDSSVIRSAVEEFATMI